jgi:hypothetical protein
MKHGRDRSGFASGFSGPLSLVSRLDPARSVERCGCSSQSGHKIAARGYHSYSERTVYDWPGLQPPLLQAAISSLASQLALGQLWLAVRRATSSLVDAVPFSIRAGPGSPLPNYVRQYAFLFAAAPWTCAEHCSHPASLIDCRHPHSSHPELAGLYSTDSLHRRRSGN